MMRRRVPRAFAPDPDAPGQACDMPGCAAAGAYRAPKSRSNLRDYWWFCLEHVRGYNAAWDYYKGMSPAQIEAELRADTAWGRPTWPLGRLGSSFDASMLHDPLRVFEFDPARARREAEAAPSELREPLRTLGLSWPLTMEILKTRYKELAKQHHPDANPDDTGAEERLKHINLAYAAVRSHLAPAPAATS
ncbi:MAG: J domain-containing protein [Rhodospirillales bacterium]|nr:J domain-containing protein [Rhodospirillales bacterium]